MISKVKLGATLFFDSEKERDIVEQVDELRNRHKLGNFLNDTIRFAYKYREQFNREYKDGEHLTADRQQFFDKVQKQVSDMQNKIDTMYKMTNEMHTLLKMNKKLGVEEKVNNMYSAQFVAQKQLKALCDLLGIQNLHIYDSDKIFNANKHADDMVEYILTYYDGIMGEVQNSLNNSKVDIEALVNALSNIQNNTATQDTKQEKPEKHTDKKTETAGKVVQIKDSDTVDFETSSEADLAGIENLASSMLL